jgi:hypothetical protein
MLKSETPADRQAHEVGELSGRPRDGPLPKDWKLAKLAPQRARVSHPDRAPTARDAAALPRRGNEGALRGLVPAVAALALTGLEREVDGSSSMSTRPLTGGGGGISWVMGLR